MKQSKPNVTIIGGIETGKTSTIQILWEKNVVDYDCHDGIHCFSIQELLEGRGFVDFDVYELPRINYTSNDWVTKTGVKECLESSDKVGFSDNANAATAPRAKLSFSLIAKISNFI